MVQPKLWSVLFFWKKSSLETLLIYWVCCLSYERARIFKPAYFFSRTKDSESEKLHVSGLKNQPRQLPWLPWWSWRPWITFRLCNTILKKQLFLPFCFLVPPYSKCKKKSSIFNLCQQKISRFLVFSFSFWFQLIQRIDHKT